MSDNKGVKKPVVCERSERVWGVGPEPETNGIDEFGAVEVVGDLVGKWIVSIVAGLLLGEDVVQVCPAK